jgi:hypothetical protein
MRKFHSITALCGDGLRPELQALFNRLAVDPHSELFVRDDGMTQAGPDPASETAPSNITPLTKGKVHIASGVTTSVGFTKSRVAACARAPTAASKRTDNA